MATIKYDKRSPYSKTEFHGQFLDVATLPQIPKLVDDVRFQINQTYQYRPDLLAFDLYGDSRLWWVFALRNPNVIIDPVFDMRTGVVISIPKKENLTAIL